MASFKFILTKELGRLARWLRILGFDVTYYDSNNLGTLIIEALREERIIVTRRKSKIDELEKKTVVIAYDDVKGQLRQLIEKLNLQIDKGRMFTRCVICNQILVEAKKEEMKNRVPEYVFKTQKDFMACPSCQRVYWQGSHWGNINKILEDIVWKKRDCFLD